MQIVDKPLSRKRLQQIAQLGFVNLVKAVIDIEKEIVALDAELHADLEAHLIENGSQQKNLWGINLYPEISGDDFLEYDSMINIRPLQNNLGRGVDDGEIRDKIRKIIDQLFT